MLNPISNNNKEIKEKKKKNKIVKRDTKKIRSIVYNSGTNRLFSDSWYIFIIYVLVKN